MELPLFHCPVEGCEYWVAFGGYTSRDIKVMKHHVRTSHHALGQMAIRDDGGLVDRVLATALQSLAVTPTANSGGA